MATDPDATLPGVDAALDVAPRGIERGSGIGRYVVLSELGAGGMGVVYAAYDPELDRKVALKLLHADPGQEAPSPTAQTRLLREAQALAKLNHPNVVAIHDVGTTRARVWIAMEFVDGQTLSAWSAEARRDWREVLEVMVAAGEGLAAAHEAGLLHRDFKPDNVMVGTDARVRVMDFGLALGGEAARDETHELDARLSPQLDALALRVTRDGALLGTPAFMAPEQVSGREVDARSDQFSFCAALWVSLYGQRPFAGETLMEIANAVASGTLRPPPRDRNVPSWLREICERGLETEPSERFADVRALLRAIRRGRDRIRTRTRAAVATAVVLAGVGIFLARGGSPTQECERTGAEIEEVWTDDVRARVENGLRATSSSYAESTAERVTRWLDASAQDWRTRRAEACARERVSKTWDAAISARAQWCLQERKVELASLVEELQRADEKLFSDAISAAALLGDSAHCVDDKTLANLPAPPTSADQAEVLELRRAIARLRAAGHTGTAAAARLPEAAALRDRVEAAAWPPLVATHATMEFELFLRTGAYEEAEAAAVRAYKTAAKTGAWETAAAAAKELIVLVGVRGGRPGEGRQWGMHAELAAELAGDPRGLREAQRLNALAALDYQEGRYDDGLTRYERALELTEAALGPEHPTVATYLGNLAGIHNARGDLEQARLLLRRGLEISSRVYGPDHPQLASSYNNLAIVEHSADNEPAAIEAFTHALRLREAGLPPDHPWVPTTLVNLANVHDSVGDYDEAVALSERALAIQDRIEQPPRQVMRTLNTLGIALLARGDAGPAREHLARAHALGVRHLDADQPALALAHCSYAQALRQIGELPEARRVVDEGILFAYQSAHAESWLGMCLQTRGRIDAARGDAANARASLLAALALREASMQPRAIAHTVAALGELDLDQGRPQTALHLLRRARENFESLRGIQHRELGVRFLLARALAASGGDPVQARAHATAAREGYAKLGPGRRPDVERIDAWLARN